MPWVIAIELDVAVAYAGALDALSVYDPTSRMFRFEKVATPFVTVLLVVPPRTASGLPPWRPMPTTVALSSVIGLPQASSTVTVTEMFVASAVYDGSGGAVMTSWLGAPWLTSSDAVSVNTP